MRDFYLVLNSIVALALIVLSIVAFLSDKKSHLNRLFLFFSGSVALWLVAASISNDIRIDNDIALIAKYVVFLCSYFASFFILLFASNIAAKAPVQKKIKKLAPLLVLVGIVSATPLVVAGIEVQGAVYAVTFGPLIAVYAAALFGQLIGALVLLHVGRRHARGKKRIQLTSIYRALVVAVPILLATQFIIPALTGIFQITDIGILIMALPVVALYISVVRHGLFDVRAAVVRGMAYVLVLTSLGLVYYLLAYGASLLIFKGTVSAGLSLSPVNVVLALLLAFLFQPFKRFFDKLTNQLFYKEMYSSEEFYEGLNAIVRVTVSLRQLVSKSSEFIKETLKADSVSFFVYKGENSIVSGGSEGYKKIPLADIHAFDSMRRPLYVGDPTLPVEIRRILVSHKLAVAVPLYRNNDPVGLMCLGEHRTSHYSHRDIRVLRVAAGELVVGIQNALAIQEIRDLNENLQQRIDAATKELRRSNAQLQRLDETKDEFISMASHQLRTPLTSIKGYVSMLIDGDLGKISPQQRGVLEEAFSSSERMVHLIGDFLNVSRLQTGKFVIEKRPTDLAELIASEVSALKQNAESRGLKLKYVKPKNIPVMELDADKLRQVVMNFMDNAMYYSKSESTITITLKKVGESVEFAVKDTGIGVPEAEQAGLFTKFFRASNARKTRPDGTGVGLFLAKKVVADHKGEIIFQSKEGKGSTFGFRLPLPPAA